MKTKKPINPTMTFWATKYDPFKKRKIGYWEGRCMECGNVYRAKRSNSKTCSPACRQKLSRRTKDN